MIRIDVSEDGNRATLHAPDTFTTASVLAGLRGAEGPPSIRRKPRLLGPVTIEILSFRSGQAPRS